MEHFVTLFDSLFLPQGLALHISMERYIKNYTLWILCVDDQTHEVLIKLNLSNVRLLKLSKLETEALLAIKPTRSKGEYCWTLTPFALRFVFEADSDVLRVTYLDADLWFLKDPASIFREFDLSNKQVLITDHGYAPEYDQSATSGQYCVQFMVFNRQGGELVRKWWEERCIEWCYARLEDNKFGDQKYLDQWPEHFSNDVHVLVHKEWTLAPWNATRFPYGDGLFWHFHAFRLVGRHGRCISKADFGHYSLPQVTQNYVYKPYVNDIVTAIGLLRQHGIEPRPQKVFNYWDRIKSPLRALLRERWRLLNGTMPLN